MCEVEVTQAGEKECVVLSLAFHQCCPDRPDSGGGKGMGVAVAVSQQSLSWRTKVESARDMGFSSS